MKSNSSVKNAAKNTYGVLIYWFSQWLTTIIVYRVSGAAYSGKYAVAMSFVALLFAVMSFGISPVLLSDTEGRNKGYLPAYGVSSTLAIMLFCIGLIILKFDPATVKCAVALLLYKLSETLYQYINTLMLADDNYDSVAISYTLKSIFPFGAFCGALAAFHSVPIAILAMLVMYLLTVLLFDIRKYFRGFNKAFSRSDVFNILKTAFPVMLNGFYLPLIHFITRYVVQLKFTEDTAGSYATISMLLTAVGMVFSSVWATFIVKMSRQYSEKQYAAIKKHIIVTMLSCMAIAAVASPVCWLLRNVLVNLLFGEAMLPYAHLFLPILLAGGLLGVSAYFSTVFLAAGRRVLMLIGGICCAVTCAICVLPFVNLWGLIGAVYSIIAAALIQIIVSVGFAIRILSNKKKGGRILQ